jgi:hypothetical protein
MCNKLIYFISFVFVLSLRAGVVEAGVLYPAPDEWWTYIYTGDAAAADLDGTWDHDNGSDEWDSSQIGVAGTEPGGVSALTEGNTNFVRLQDVFDHDPGDEPSNRKIYFGHDIGAEGAPDNVVDAATLSFRARIPTTPPLDPLNGSAATPWPDGGDGYIIHHEGKGNFSIGDVDDRLISFSLALDTDDAALSDDGLIMNNLNGTSPSGDVDTGEGGTLNQLVLDPTEWHEFWITIEADTSGGGTHKVTIWIDGDVENPSTFHVTAGRGDRAYETINYLALGTGNTNHNGAFDVDFFAYKEGIFSPADIVKASNPGPADGVMLEDTWTNLSWVPGAYAVSHDVYLSDNFDDVSDGTGDAFQGNQTITTLLIGFPGFPFPDGLVPGATYYWRIDEVNDTEPDSPWKGNVWSFTVPPKTAYWPDPADGAESVDPDVGLSWTGGFGSKLHTVYFGENFDDVNNATEGVTQGITTYTPGPLKLAKTYYWRIDEFDAVTTYKGDVWSFTTEGAVGNPNPSNGAMDVERTPVLSWTPGIYAASHQLYFGTDKDAVRNADTTSPEFKATMALGAESYDPGKLQWYTTYYWRIDEVNDTNPDSPWTGNVWSFTTADFIVIDDFEDYNDYPPDEIFSTWIDGWEVPTNGSLAGHPDPPFAETDNVHGGSQSMPLYYDNNFMYSEATMTLVSVRDWTEENVGVLSLWFYGDAANAAERMYVALNGSAVVYHGNPNAALIEAWTEWRIDLQEFAAQGVNLYNVNTITIGFGDKNNLQAGGSGMVLFDDIRLYRPAEPEPEPQP